jgi:hypothetical protein
MKMSEEDLEKKYRFSERRLEILKEKNMVKIEE